MFVNYCLFLFLLHKKRTKLLLFFEIRKYFLFFAMQILQFAVLFSRFLWLGLRCRQITPSPSSLHVRTFVTVCRPSSLCHVFAQGHKRRRSARHTLNAGVTITSQPRANRIPLLYPCYTLTIFLHFAYKTKYFYRFLPKNLCMCKKSSIFA